MVGSPQKAVEIIPMPQAFIPSNDNSSSTNLQNYLAPENLCDSFLLGEIAAKLQGTSTNSSEDVPVLLEEASAILHLNGKYNLTVQDVTEGVPQAIHLKEAKSERFKILRGALSFVGVLSIIAAIGILVTIGPLIILVWKALHLDDLWKALLALFSFLRHVVDPLLYCVSIYVLTTSMHYPETSGGRSQIAILAAGFAIITYVYRTSKKIKLRRADHDTMIFFIWCWSFLVPMALLSESRFLGFFSVGSIFAALGFIALPMPFGWSVGFQDRMSLDRSMLVSLIILFASLGARAGLYPIPGKIMDIFETGAAVFGMLSFGLGGLIKSMDMASWPSFNIWSFIYPMSWVGVAFFGSIYSYDSLTNTSITCIVLWMTQFYWRLVGVHMISVFIASSVLYVTSLWLKTHPDFVVNLFKV